MEKRCKSCLVTKDLDEFYTHPETADRHLSVCIECKKKQTRARSKTDGGKASEKRRNSKPARKTKLAKRSKSWRTSNPEKARAHSNLWSAIRRGVIIKSEICERCGNGGQIHAHHHDYSKPLEVEWLCVPCHGKENPSFIPL